ncbi:hypothetical protein ACIQGZ_17255 [Streptomyces sp. NPDC092296]|uniref:hypothetical protein n=1 Tax=Streptomyces sp. NPDC092296 TaxID=3366012 RepID=UPI00382DB2E1
MHSGPAYSPAEAALLARAETAERKLARIEQMAGAWERHYPRAMQTAAVVAAIRATIHPEP